MSNAYTNSPACLLVATHCAACGKPLVDAISVECAVGPDCRRKHGYNEAQLPADFALAAKVLAKANVELDLTDSHRAANKLVWLVAVNSNGALVAFLAAYGTAKRRSMSSPPRHALPCGKPSAPHCPAARWSWAQVLRPFDPPALLSRPVPQR